MDSCSDCCHWRLWGHFHLLEFRLLASKPFFSRLQLWTPPRGDCSCGHGEGVGKGSLSEDQAPFRDIGAPFLHTLFLLHPEEDPQVGAVKVLRGDCPMVWGASAWPAPWGTCSGKLVRCREEEGACRGTHTVEVRCGARDGCRVWGRVAPGAVLCGRHSSFPVNPESASSAHTLNGRPKPVLCLLQAA